MTAATYVKPIASIIRAPEARWDETTQVERTNSARKAEASRRAEMRNLVSQFRR
jgi:hypothetical protein